MQKANLDIRQAIEKSGLRYWMVAYSYGCTDTTFSRKLRRELPTAEKDKILRIIRELKQEVS